MNILITKQLFQWDTDRWVEIEKKETETVESVQFSIDGKLAYDGKLKEENKYLIPNQLLYQAGYLKCYVCVSDEYGNRTETRRSIKVFDREKPNGFVEEEQIPLWKELEQKIDALEVPTKLSQLEEDSEHKTVTEQDISNWNAKTDFIPRGGRPGQVLTKKSETDYEAEWRDVSGASVISWNGRAGAVVPQANDYDYTQIKGLIEQLDEIKKG